MLILNSNFVQLFLQSKFIESRYRLVIHYSCKHVQILSFTSIPWRSAFEQIFSISWLVVRPSDQTVSIKVQGKTVYIPSIFPLSSKGCDSFVKECRVKNYLRTICNLKLQLGCFVPNLSCLFLISRSCKWFTVTTATTKDLLPSSDWINMMYTARRYMHGVLVFHALLAVFQPFNSENQTGDMKISIFYIVFSEDPLPSRDWINPMYTARCNIYSVFVFNTQRKAKLAGFQTFNSGNYRQVMCYEKFYKTNVSHRTNTGVL